MVTVKKINPRSFIIALTTIFCSEIIIIVQSSRITTLGDSGISTIQHQEHNSYRRNTRTSRNIRTDNNTGNVFERIVDLLVSSDKKQQHPNQDDGDEKIRNTTPLVASPAVLPPPTLPGTTSSDNNIEPSKIPFQGLNTYNNETTQSNAPISMKSNPSKIVAPIQPNNKPNQNNATSFTVSGSQSVEPLYCFPDVANRKRYNNVWKKFIVEVKEAETLCGPRDNRFSRQTVSYANNKLKLQVRNIDGIWTSSEVRIVLADGSPFSYGLYNFSVSKVSVIDAKTGKQKWNDLPRSIAFGMFTWDPTDDYSIRENYNHEVDIEISRWNQVHNKDGQFLVQPSGYPQRYRFYTGSNTAKTRNPGGQIYQFNWNPGEIVWYTTAGGRQRHRYTTAQAIRQGRPDYVQCLPAQVEIRINLWNFIGTQNILGMINTDIVEVVVDNFDYKPSNRTGIHNGSPCSKDCQCKTTSKCIKNICTSQ